MSSRTRPTRRRRADGLRARPLLDLFAEAGKNAAVAADMLDDLLAHWPDADGLARQIRLENEGDRILREGVAALFHGGIDPMVVIRWKDVFERIEEGVDACESAAHLLEGIAVKQA